MSFLQRFINYFVVFLIFLFSVSSIFLEFIIDDLDDSDFMKKPALFMTNFESRFYDYRMKPNLKNLPSNDNIVLIEIDDKSLQEINSWPIPRENYKTLLDNLAKYGANTVAFDVLFPEPVKTCGELSPDDIFAESIRNFQSLPLYTDESADDEIGTKNFVQEEVSEDDGFDDEQKRTVILAYSVQERAYKDQENLKNEPPFELLMTTVTGKGVESCHTFQENGVEKHTWPIQKLIDSEAFLGYLNMEEDQDGVFRHYKLFAKIRSEENQSSFLFPSLALATYMNTADTSGLKVEMTSQCTSEIVFNGKTLMTDPRGDTKIRWIGAESKFKSIPLYRVLKGENFEYEKENENGESIKEYIDLKQFFAGKTVFVGSTATGAHDLRNTAIDPKLPGIYNHMNMLNMLQKQFFYKPLSENITNSLYLLIGTMIIIIVVMFFNKPILDIFTLVAIIAVTYYIDQIKYIPEGYQLKLFYCYFSITATYSWLTFLNFNQSNAEKKQIKGAFSRYVAPSIVDDMLDNPDKLKVGGEKRDITCMFSDVRDFTSISEALSPTELALALNIYMGKMTDIVFETNGTLDKYIGDAIVAFWGAPIDIGDHVNQSVDAGVRMLEALPAINEEFKQRGFPEFKIGLGLNSGECSVGNMGSDQIFAYTALGDNMNLGARLESLCKYYGAQILISEYTYARLDHERFTCRLIDNVIVKGKTEPVGVYEVLYSYHTFMLDPEALKKFKEAFELFLDAKFAAALVFFKELNEKYPDDKASARMKETCEHWMNNPPAQGEDFRVTTMKTKG